MQSSPLITKTTNWKPAQSWAVFVTLTVALLWLIHAVAFFAHEYAHSLTAWLLGWKDNPLALHYGQWTTSNLLIQSDIDENVNYDLVFAGGHGIQAAVIAAAGVTIGNALITYGISRWRYAKAKKKGSYTWALIWYWMCTASVGNLLCYVPVRTFAPSGDMYTVSQGWPCSPWWIMVVLGIPFAIIFIHFFLRVEPQALRWLFPQSKSKRVVMVLLTSAVMFGFYGAAGWSARDAVSHTLSAVCVYGLLPVMMIISYCLTEQTGNVEVSNARR